MQTALTLKSRNEKTGPIPVSTTSEASCPDACPLRGFGCYAETGKLRMFWQKVTEGRAGGTYEAFLKQISALKDGQLWRHNQSGDLIGDRINISLPHLNALIKANRGKRGFTYTHYDVIRNKANRKAIAQANRDGFTVNLSGNNFRHADALADTNAGPVVVVLPSHISGNVKLETPKGRKIVVCPATYRDDVTCKSCGLCAVRDRDVIVGFPAHGVRRKAADKIAA